MNNKIEVIHLSFDVSTHWTKLTADIFSIYSVLCVCVCVWLSFFGWENLL